MTNDTADGDATHWPVRARLELHRELHARPALSARSPCVVSSWAHMGMSTERARAALAALCHASDVPVPAPDVRHHVLHAPDFAVKFERHGEFVSWQVNRPLPAAAAAEAANDDVALRGLLLDSDALAALPGAFTSLLSGEGAGRMVAATHVVMLPSDDADAMLPRCRAVVRAQAERAGDDDAASVMGAFIGDARRGAVLTNLRLSPDGFVRFMLLDFGLPPDQAAREAQRLCEVEAYRMLAMLGFPVAQRLSAELGELERSLQGAVDMLASQDTEDDSRAFDMLTRLAAEVEHATAHARFRFCATHAYHRIVERRLADLREQRIEGVQTLSGFLSRRFAPAMAFCASIDRRLTDIAERINRAVDLARVRVDMQRGATNQDLFKALARRQHLQLRLQQAVEGLSVVAISYYALGLVGYLAKATKPLHEMNPDVLVGAAVLPVVGGAFWFAHRLRKHLAHD